MKSYSVCIYVDDEQEARLAGIAKERRKLTGKKCTPDDLLQDMLNAGSKAVIDERLAYEERLNELYK